MLGFKQVFHSDERSGYSTPTTRLTSFIAQTCAALFSYNSLTTTVYWLQIQHALLSFSKQNAIEIPPLHSMLECESDLAILSVCDSNQSQNLILAGITDTPRQK